MGAIGTGIRRRLAVAGLAVALTAFGAPVTVSAEFPEFDPADASDLGVTPVDAEEDTTHRSDGALAEDMEPADAEPQAEPQAGAEAEDEPIAPQASPFGLEDGTRPHLTDGLLERLETLEARPLEQRRVRVIVSFRDEAIASLRSDSALDTLQEITLSTLSGLGEDYPANPNLSDPDVRSALDERRFRRTPGMALVVDESQLERLARLPYIALIEEDIGLPVPDLRVGSLPADPPAMNQVMANIGSVDGISFGGFNGSGHSVAILDTGVDAGHPFFAGPGGTSRVVHEICRSSTFVVSGADTRRWSESLCPEDPSTGAPLFEGPGVADDCPASISGCGHGTHVAGIAAGSPTELRAVAGDSTALFSGVAHAAAIIAVQVFSEVDCAIYAELYSPVCRAGVSRAALSFSSDRVLAIEDIIDLAEQEAVPPVASINMSIGGDAYMQVCDDSHPTRTAEQEAAALAEAAGIAVIAAAGNDGLSDAISAPACLSSVIAVASSTIEVAPDASQEQISDYSNLSDLVDLVAPAGGCTYDGDGEVQSCSGVLSAVPRGTGSALSTADWGVKLGTSMAAPQVAGAFAVLRQADPTIGVRSALLRLDATGVPISDLRYGPPGVQKPRIDVGSAIAAIGDLIVAHVPPMVWNLNVSSSHTLVATGGLEPYGWSLESGSLPPGVMLSAAGVLSGAPAAVGEYPFVVRVDDSSAGASATRSVSIEVIDARLPTPVGLSPNALVGELQPTFAWFVENDEGDLHRLQVLDADRTVVRDFETPVGEACTFNEFYGDFDCAFTPVQGLPSGSLMWRVRAEFRPENGGGAGRWSAELSFAVPVVDPPTPWAVRPTSVSDPMSRPTFAWYTAAGAGDVHRLQVLSSSQVLLRQWVSSYDATCTYDAAFNDYDCSFTPDDDLPSGQLRWRVRAEASDDPARVGEWSRTLDFTVPPPLNPVRSLAVRVAAGSATASWSPPVGVSAGSLTYEVATRSRATSSDAWSDWTEAACSGGAGTTCPLASSGFSGWGRQHQVRVRAVGPSSSSPWAVGGPVTPYTSPLVGEVTFTPSAGNRELQVSWDPAAFSSMAVARGAEVSRVEVTASTVDGRGRVVRRSCSVSRRVGRNHALGGSCVVSRLVNGTSYTVEVRAQNAGGWSASRSVGTVTPVPVAPDAVRSVRVQARGGELRVTWSPPGNDGGAPPVYAVEVRESGAADEVEWTEACSDLSSRVRSCVVDGDVLSAWGVAYDVRVRAENSQGESDWVSVESPVAFAAPAVSDLSLSVSPENRGLAVSWVDGLFDGELVARGAEVSRVEVRATPDRGRGRSCAVSRRVGRGLDLASGCSISRLVNDAEYRVEVRAQNGGGWSDWAVVSADAADRTPVPVAPDAVRSVRVQARGGELRVSWSPPRNDGGARIVGYRVEVSVSTSSGDDLAWTVVAETGSLRSVEVIADDLEGLWGDEQRWGAEHRFRITATNGTDRVGQDRWSPPVASAAVRPFAAPDASTVDVSVDAADRSLDVTWASDAFDASTVDRGGEVSRVEVRATPVGGGRASTCAVTRRAGRDLPMPDGCTVSRLPELTNLAVEVRAQNRAGWSDWAPIGTALTIPEDVPSDHGELTVLGLDGAPVTGPLEEDVTYRFVGNGFDPEATARVVQYPDREVVDVIEVSSSGTFEALLSFEAVSGDDVIVVVAVGTSASGTQRVLVRPVSFDVLGPEIVGLLPDGGEFGPGDVFTVAVTVRDPSGIESVGFSFARDGVQRDFCGQWPSFSSADVDAGTETWTYDCTVPDMVVGGEYVISAYAEDALGNWTNTNGGREQLVTGSFAVVDGLEAIDDGGDSSSDDDPRTQPVSVAPVLESFSLVSAGPYSSGDEVVIEFDWRAESADGLEFVQFRFEDAIGRPYVLLGRDFVGEGGTVSVTLDDQVSAGDAELVLIELRDTRGDSVVYYPDGDLSKWPRGLGGQDVHAFDFSSYSFAVESDASA